MNKKLYLIAALFAGQQAVAQTPEDALRMTWGPSSGTARHQAIGGAMGALGGEISSLFTNPAGLAFYKTSEFVISPGFNMAKSNSDFRGTGNKSDALTRFGLGTTGFVIGYNDPYSKFSNKAFSIAINRTANFNSHINYKGQNDYSSYSEQAVEEFSRSNLPIDVSLPTAALSLQTKLANYTYLFDTVTTNQGLELVGLPQRDAILAGQDAFLMQERDITTKGGINEISIGFASNMDDNIYMGLSVGVPIVNFERTSTFTETDISGNTNNNFNYSKYEETYTSKGVGFNAKFGLIFKPADQIRIGAAIHTPSLYALKEKTTGRMENDLEGYFSNPAERIRIADSKTIYDDNNVDQPKYKYNFTSPWKFIVGGAYVIREVEDVSLQKGFISADIEYVSYKSSKFKASQEGDDKSYYDGVNEATKELYKGALNFRLGGELKFNTIMTRLGFAYYSNPYKDKELKGHRMNLSGGLGYRAHGIFIDLTYIQTMNKDTDFPYRLTDKANTFADVKENYGSVMMTFGIKL